MAVEWFDACVRLGRTKARPHFEFAGTVDNIVAAMDRFGIAEALVHHASGDETHPTVGNRLLFEACAGQSRLYPCVTLLPPGTGEFASADEAVAELFALGARAARMSPACHSYRLCSSVCGDTLAALQERRMPLFLDMSRYNDWASVEAVADDFADLPIVLEAAPYAATRNMYPLLASHANVYIEIHSYEIHNGLEHIVPRIGADRLLFGSGLPEFSPASPMTMLACARLTDEDKLKIARNNLVALLQEVK